MVDQPKPPCDHGGGESWRFPPMITDPTIWCLDCGSSRTAKSPEWLDVPRMTADELAKLREDETIHPVEILDAWQDWIDRGWAK